MTETIELTVDGESQALEFEIERVSTSDLRPHPKNYRIHPDDQVAHIIQSIKENGLYRNVVVARDNTILAGHGVVKALKTMGVKEIPVYRADADPDSPRALKILAGDNEIENLAMVDDRQLSEILKEVRDLDETGLMGTGFDDMMLANLLFVTRPKGEVEDFDEAAEWVGMPDYESTPEAPKIHVSFQSEEHKQRFIEDLNLIMIKPDSCWWPPKGKEHPSALKFEG